MAEICFETDSFLGIVATTDVGQDVKSAVVEKLKMKCAGCRLCSGARNIGTKNEVLIAGDWQVDPKLALNDCNLKDVVIKV